MVIKVIRIRIIRITRREIEIIRIVRRRICLGPSDIQITGKYRIIKTTQFVLTADVVHSMCLFIFLPRDDIPNHS